MKPLLILTLSLTLCLTVFGQPDYPDSGFTNKAEAKNLYKNTLKEGKWLEYRVTKSSNGEVDTVGYDLIIYKEGKPNGTVRYYWKNANEFSLNTETPYVNGIINGLQKEYYSGEMVTNHRLILLDGKISYIIPFVNGKIEGVEKEYYETGELESELLYKNNKATGVEKRYYESGKIAYESNYINGLEDGVAKGYYENGVLSLEVPYSSGNLNGLRKEYYENGQLMREDPYINGKEIGIARLYYDNGKIKEEIPYSDNLVINGMHKWFYKSGKLKEECPITNGYANGVDKEYYENGNIMLEVHDTAEFVNGYIFKNYVNGDLKKYYENGRIKSRVLFANGEFGRTKYYDISGKEIIQHVSIDTLEKIRKSIIGTWVDVFNSHNTWTFFNDTIKMQYQGTDTNICWKYNIEIESLRDTSTTDKPISGGTYNQILWSPDTSNHNYWFGISYTVCGDNINHYLSGMSLDGKYLKSRDVFNNLTGVFIRKKE